eukprot:1017640-Alexandrium_andersonii.AAC.1
MRKRHPRATHGRQHRDTNTPAPPTRATLSSPCWQTHPRDTCKLRQCTQCSTQCTSLIWRNLARASPGTHGAKVWRDPARPGDQKLPAAK